MKYCLNCRQSDKLLQKADEIKITLADYGRVIDYIEKYPDKKLIFEIDNSINDTTFNWDEMAVYAKKHGDLCCCVSNRIQITECTSRGIPFYYRYMVTSLYELQALKEQGAIYALIGVPLIFDLKNAASFGIPLRTIPNLAYEDYLPHRDGLYGAWIRPEDAEIYGQYITTFEFYSKGLLEKEATLFHVYAENHEWPGNLNVLIDNLNLDLDGRAIWDEKTFAETRMSCRQKCLVGACHHCDIQWNLARVIREKAFQL